jgi:hypothetical protein
LQSQKGYQRRLCEAMKFRVTTRSCTETEVGCAGRGKEMGEWFERSSLNEHMVRHGQS